MAARSDLNYGSLEESDQRDLDHDSIHSDVHSVDIDRDRDKLGTWDGIAVVVGLQLGSGIFSSPSAVYNGADTQLGALALWIAGGLIAWTGAQSSAELGVRSPSNGGLLDYLGLCYGWNVACIASWMWIFVVKPCGTAILCNVISTHARQLMGQEMTEHHGIGRLIAVGTIAAATWLNWPGLRRSKTMARFFMTVKLLAILSVILTGFGLALFSSKESEPPTVASTNGGTEGSAFGRLGQGIFEALWAYSGWESLGFVAGEVHTPAKRIPRILNSSMALVIGAYLLANCAFFVSLPEDLIRSSRTLSADLGRRAFGTLGAVTYSILVIIICLGVVSNKVFTSSRLIQAAATSGYIPAWFSSEHQEAEFAVSRAERFSGVKAYQRAMLLNGGLTLLYTNIHSLEDLIAISGVVEYLTLVTMVAGLLKLHFVERNTDGTSSTRSRYRTARAYPAIFCLACIFALAMMLVENGLAFAAVICMLLVGRCSLFFAQHSRGGMVARQDAA